MAEQPSLAALVPRFLLDCGVQGLSQATIQTHGFALKRFVAWCEEREVLQPSEVTRPVLERYQRFVHLYRKSNGLPLSASTQCGRLGPVKMFFKWLARQNLILYNPASEMVMPRLGERIPRHVLSAEEVERVMLQPDLATPLGVRDRAILETLYSSGIRRLELWALAVEDVDTGRGTLMIRYGKGKRDRLVPIGRRALVWIRKYLEDVRPLWAHDPAQRSLFVTELGTPPGPERLTRLVRGYIEQAGLGRRGGCHLLRHTMATLMLENGADIRYIQQILGHALLSTTQIYTRVALGKLLQVHAATHPAEFGRTSQMLRLDEERARKSQAEEMLLDLAGEEAEEDLD
jgi:integrase/recombinase XerD